MSEGVLNIALAGTLDGRGGLTGLSAALSLLSPWGTPGTHGAQVYSMSLIVLPSGEACRQRKTKQQTGQASRRGKYIRYIHSTLNQIRLGGTYRSSAGLKSQQLFDVCVCVCVCEQNSTAWSCRAAAATTVSTVMPACPAFRATGATQRGEWPAGL